jgi:hypothetical protein
MQKLRVDGNSNQNTKIMPKYPQKIADFYSMNSQKVAKINHINNLRCKIFVKFLIFLKIL